MLPGLSEIPPTSVKKIALHHDIQDFGPCLALLRTKRDELYLIKHTYESAQYKQYCRCHQFWNVSLVCSLTASCSPPLRLANFCHKQPISGDVIPAELYPCQGRGPLPSLSCHSRAIFLLLCYPHPLWRQLPRSNLFLSLLLACCHPEEVSIVRVSTGKH